MRIGTIGDLIVRLQQVADTTPEGREQRVCVDYGGGPVSINDVYFDDDSPEDSECSDRVVIDVAS